MADSLTLRVAGPDDLAHLSRLVAAFHDTEGLVRSEEQRRQAITPLLADRAVGVIWMICLDAREIGYLAICFGYSIEFGGRDGFVDEFYLEASYRGRGLGTRALEMAMAEARGVGLHALHLEVDPGKETAQRVYQKLGFALRDYHLMSAMLGSLDKATPET